VYQQRFYTISEVCDNSDIQDKTTRAWYAISYLLAKHSRLFIDGIFIKDCILTAVTAFGNTLTPENIPLSHDTLK
jgi:hypothetical protein